MIEVVVVVTILTWENNTNFPRSTCYGILAIPHKHAQL